MMRYADINVGDYIIRTRPHGWAKVLSGVICYVVDIKDKCLKVQATEECMPVGTVYEIPKDGDDGYWHDITSLARTANSCIAPDIRSCMHETTYSVNYKNYIDLSGIEPLHGKDAIGSICLVGQPSTNKIALSREGYYVVDVDDIGYAVCYSGYCQTKDNRKLSSSKLVVLNMLSAGRTFYPAELIIDRCTKDYYDDLEVANKFTEKIKEKAVVAANEFGNTMNNLNRVANELVLAEV